MQQVSLDDKYLLDSGKIYLSGIQALVRLALVQRRRDQAAGLNTAGFISGYRGSPLGGLDEALWKAKSHLEAHHVRFVPGVNEELAATAVWGSQQVHLTGDSAYDGVFALWYGKGPGVDRCADVFKHMNFAGTAPRGGVLLVAGDDHGAYSSTLPHQSDHLFGASMIPVLYPCNVEEYIELGLHGWAMSRFSGCAVAFKALADTVESSASIEVGLDRPAIVLPADFQMPPGGLHARLSTQTLGQQARAQETLMQDYKIYAALAYSRANRLNRTVIDSPQARLGIVASGKSYLDVREALGELGIDEQGAAALGLRLYKVSMPWPLEPDGIREFARGLDEILVVEEKRQLVEYQLKEQLYNWRADVRPRVIGKFDERGEWVAPRGEWLLPAAGDLSIAQIARVIAGRIGRFHDSEAMRERLRMLEGRDSALGAARETPVRPPWYCSGCPHNRSTRVPEGSIALAGIGCHVMATAIYPEHNRTTTQMGGEGATWIGQAPFSTRSHVFANLGDGTWFHSGQMAMRAAVAAGVNITYKLLYNDAVAMTGGQPVDGQISVSMIVRQAAAEGVRQIAVVAEQPERFTGTGALPDGVRVHGREDLQAVQETLRTVSGVSLLVFDQTCAAEKRRRRRKGKYPVAAERVIINTAVCEGCGDCGLESNCTAIVPDETPLGRKRAIDQDACNQDFSCLQGFCPSFVTVAGVKPRRPRPVADLVQGAPLPDPQPQWDGARPWNILITGIGGTGVITIGALLGMAAHLEGRTVSVLDMTGMSQKNGAVTSHVRLGTHVGAAQRIATGEAHLILGCDLLTAAAEEAIAKARPGMTAAVVNVYQQPPGQFAQQPDWQFPDAAARGVVEAAATGSAHFVDATHLATRLLGNAVGANVFLLGYAFQLGLIPLGGAAIDRAIELNAVAVEANRRAFAWGRRAALDPAAVANLADPAPPLPFPETLDALTRHRADLLTAYQNGAYARRYLRLVDAVRSAEAQVSDGDELARAVARNLYRLMAVKDEYEVARLYSDAGFARQLEETFEGSPKLRFHLAPPLLGRRDAHGKPMKTAFGPWMRPVFQVLARLKFLRGSPLDPFGRSAERRLDQKLLQDFEAALGGCLGRLNKGLLPLAIEFADLPLRIRGFGHVRERHIEAVLPRWQELEGALAGSVHGLQPRKAA